jgi:hypothetical protein
MVLSWKLWMVNIMALKGSLSKAKKQVAAICGGPSRPTPPATDATCVSSKQIVGPRRRNDLLSYCQ